MAAPEPPWQITWAPRAVRDADNLDVACASASFVALERFAPTGHGDLKRLQGVEPPTGRQRVGDLRLVLDLDYSTHTLTVLRVLPRGRA
jgi:mRNA-degrading endonuclease RelE of RelBE toxin-antitoxin system